VGERGEGGGGEEGQPNELQDDACMYDYVGQDSELPEEGFVDGYVHKEFVGGEEWGGGTVEDEDQGGALEVEFLKSQLVTDFAVSNEYGADYLRISGRGMRLTAGIEAEELTS